MINTRFSTAVHILTELANEPGEPISSATLSERIKCHPVVIRRLIGVLKKAGVVSSSRGAHGGVKLAMDPEDIALGMIAELVDEHLGFETHTIPVSVNADQHFSDAVLSTLETERRNVHMAAMSHLDGISVQDILNASVLRAELTSLIASGVSDDDIRKHYQIRDGHLVRK